MMKTIAPSTAPRPAGVNGIAVSSDAIRATNRPPDRPMIQAEAHRQDHEIEAQRLCHPDQPVIIASIGTLRALIENRPSSKRS